MRFINKTKIVRITLVIRNIFVISLLYYLIFLVIDNTVTGFIRNTFNPDYLLIIIFITGILTVILPSTNNFESQINGRQYKLDYILVTFFAIICFFIIYYKFGNLGVSSLIISMFSGLIVFSVGIILVYSKASNISK